MTRLPFPKRIVREDAATVRRLAARLVREMAANDWAAVENTGRLIEAFGSSLACCAIENERVTRP